MEHIQQPNEERRKSVFHIMDHAGSEGEISHLKSELALMQRKYDRLSQKEKRLQASTAVQSRLYRVAVIVSSLAGVASRLEREGSRAEAVRRFLPSSECGRQQLRNEAEDASANPQQGLIRAPCVAASMLISYA